MNVNYYTQQLNIYLNYKNQLTGEISKLKEKINGNYYKGEYSHEYNKALKTYDNLKEKLTDLEFNIKWTKERINSL